MVDDNEDHPLPEEVVEETAVAGPSPLKRGVNLAKFEVEGVIIHEIPKRAPRLERREGGGGDSVPKLTNRECELEVEFQHYLENKIKVSLGSSCFPLSFLTNTTAQVPPLVKELFDCPADDPGFVPKFIDSSCIMANALHASQSAVPPAGLLAVVRGKLRTQPFVAMLKLEKEEGLRFDLQPTEDGGLRMEAKVEHQLAMTQNTKVFKSGLFRLSEDNQLIEGWLSDSQSGFGDRGNVVANFFLDKFLGCKIEGLPEMLTKAFLDESERWVQHSVADAVEQAGITRALMTELASNNEIINPNEFAKQYIDPKSQDSFIAALAARDAPTTPFRKNTDLIAKRLREVKISFKSGISVNIAQKLFDEEVAKLERDPDDDTISILTIRGVVERIRGV